MKDISQNRKLFKAPPLYSLMLSIKKVSEVIGKRVFTDSGDFFGEVEEAILLENKVDSWRIRVAREMAVRLNGARGVIIPHQFVKAIGDVFVINKANLPIADADEPSSDGGATVDLSEEKSN
jgi:sporulation protein YlmC with PRC-barrel domain